MSGPTFACAAEVTDPPASACSCGNTEPHIIARRVTADGARIEVYSDGSVTQRGFYLRGLGTPRSRWATRVRIASVRLMTDDFCVLDLAEIVPAIKVAEKTYPHRWSNDTDRRLYALRQIKVAS